MILLVCLAMISVAVVQSNCCSEIPNSNPDMWIYYDQGSEESSYPAGTKAYFLCSGDAPRRGDIFATCNDADGWSGNAICKAYPGNVTNVAIGKTATQSSVYNNDGVASHGIDGNPSGTWEDWSCTHTLSSSNPWWTVNLGGTYAVKLVRIYNRVDGEAGRRLLGAQVRVGTASDPRDNPVVATLGNDQIAQNPIEVVLDDVQASTVTVTIPGSARVLTLCEVEVLTEIWRCAM